MMLRSILEVKIKGKAIVSIVCIIKLNKIGGLFLTANMHLPFLILTIRKIIQIL